MAAKRNSRTWSIGAIKLELGNPNSFPSLPFFYKFLQALLIFEFRTLMLEIYQQVQKTLVNFGIRCGTDNDNIIKLKIIFELKIHNCSSLI